MSIKTLASRLQYMGGDALGRINRQKLNGLRAALKNDYNSRMIKTPLNAAWPALINANNLKPDYDKKIVSVEYDSELEPGDVFECLDDGTHWMIYLPVLTETAYLKSEIIRCRYTLTIDDTVYWIYFQGPTETDIRWFIKRGINLNELNLSGTIFIKNTPQTRAFFDRFTHIKVDNHMWEVQVTDSISVPGVLELEVQEYYDNTIAELPEIIDQSQQGNIIGQEIVKQDVTVGYFIPKEDYDKDLEWKVTGNPRVKITDILDDGQMCKVRIYDGAVGGYTVSYGEHSIDVQIDWERPYIQGPVEIYPYDFYTYEGEGVFSVNSKLVRIVEQDGTKCVIEVLTGKRGSFVLTCETPTGSTKELSVEIKSLWGGSNEENIGIVS